MNRLAIVILLLSVGAVHAQTGASPSASAPPRNGDPANQLFFGYTNHHYASGSDGRETSIDFLRRFGSSVRILAGGVNSSIADTSWRFGRLGVAVTPFARTQFYLEANSGNGQRGTRQFDYRLGRGAVTVELVKKTFYLEAEDQYVDIDTAKGHIGRGGLVLMPAPSLRIGLGYHKSLGGNMGARSISGRADWTIDRTTLLAGFSKGRTRPELFQVFDRPAASDSDELFAGIEVPVASQKLTVVYTSLDLEEDRRRSVIFNWRVPF